MKHRRAGLWTPVIMVFVVVNAAADPGRDRNHSTPVAPGPARLIAGQAASVREAIDSGTLATGSGPRLRIKPVQILSGQGSINGDTITLQSGPAILKFDILFGGWGSAGGGLTTFHATVLKSCIGGADAGLPCPPNDCDGGFCGIANGAGSPLDRPHNTCGNNADCIAAYAAANSPYGPRCNQLLPDECEDSWQEYGTRPDWPGAGTGSVFNVLGCGTIGTACGSSTSNPTLPDDGTEKYNATFVMAADANARGTYTLTIDPQDIGGNYMQLDNNDVLQYGKVIPAFVKIRQDDVCVGGSSAGADCSQHADCPLGRCKLKNRFISFTPSAIAPTGGIQVTLVSLDSNSVADPAAYNGTVRWVGPPTINVTDVPSDPFNAAPLQCAFHSQDWNAVGRLHIYGAAVVPGSQYDVRICETETGPCSAPLRIETAKFGDIVAPLNLTNFQDIGSVLDKFAGRPTAPSKTRTKLREPVNPASLVNFQEAQAATSAFQGRTYKQLAPTPPPTCP